MSTPTTRGPAATPITYIQPPFNTGLVVLNAIHVGYGVHAVEARHTPTDEIRVYLYAENTAGPWWWIDHQQTWTKDIQSASWWHGKYALGSAQRVAEAIIQKNRQPMSWDQPWWLTHLRADATQTPITQKPPTYGSW